MAGDPEKSVPEGQPPPPQLRTAASDIIDLSLRLLDADDQVQATRSTARRPRPDEWRKAMHRSQDLVEAIIVAARRYRERREP